MLDAPTIHLPKRRVLSPSPRDVLRCNTSHGHGFGLQYGRLPAVGTPAFNPASYPGYMLDYNSSQGVVLNGSNVSAWADQASGFTASQGTAANQPPYSATGINSHPSLTMLIVSSTSRWLSTSTAPTFTNSSFYFVLVQPVQHNLYENFASFNLTPAFYTINGHPGLEFGAMGFRDFTDLTISAASVVAFITSSGQTKCSRNGVFSSLVLNLTTPTNDTPLTLGAGTAAGAGAGSVLMGRALGYNQAHTLANHNALVAGLKTQFSIP